MLLFFQWVVTWILLAREAVGDFAPVVNMYDAKDQVLNILYFDDSPNVVAMKPDSVMASYDDGVSWNDIDIMKGKKVRMLVFDPINKSRAFALSRNTEHFVTTNKGKTWTKFTTDSTKGDVGLLNFTGASVNAQDPNLAILKFDKCVTPYDTSCTHYHYYTTDGFKSVKLLTKNSETCIFAMSTPQFTAIKEPSTIVCTQVKFNSFGHVVELHLVASADFFKTERGIEHPILRFGKVLELRVVQLFMVVVVQRDKYLAKSQVAILVSKDAETFEKADLELKVSSGAIYFLDSSPLALFLSVETRLVKDNLTLARMYRSDSSGLQYTQLNDDLGTITKLQNTDGVWFVTESVRTYKEPIQDVFLSDYYDYISKISVDDGRTWSRMEVVDEDSCQLKDRCSLHVLSVNSFDEKGWYVSGPTPNILVASGTTGECLGAYKDYKTYVSRDGGLTWRVTLNEPTVASYGDQGNIIVALPLPTKNRKPTTKGMYSLDQGNTWGEFPLEKSIYPFQVVTTLDGTGKKFILNGVDVGNGYASGMIVYSVDFTGAFGGVKCLDNDLEKVYARVSDDLTSCIYGHRESFMRRKPDAKCFVNTHFEDMKVKEELCDCTEQDFECAPYFEMSQGDCVPVSYKIAALCASQKKESVKLPNKQLQIGNQCKSDPQGFITTEELKCSEYYDDDPQRITSTPFEFEGTLSQYWYYNYDPGDVLWEIIIVLTREGASYGSHNGGRSFDRNPDSFKVLDFLVSPVKGTIAVITDSDVFYYTTSGFHDGNKLRIPGTPALKMRTISFHPKEPSKFMWFSGDCGEIGASDCVAYYTEDGGESFLKLLDGVVTCDYVSSAFGIVGTEMIYCTMQKGDKKSLVSSTSFFKEKEPTVLFENIVSYAVRNGFVIVATIDINQELRAKVTVDGTTFASADFPSDFKVKAQTAYAILDSGSHSIFMHVTTDKTPGHERGAILKSNSNGTSYVLVLDNVNRNTLGYVDYDRMEGIEGVLMANTVHNPDSGPKKLKTQISFNDGSQWSYLPPPAVDSEGKKYPCSGSLVNCSLNLFGFTERPDYRDTYSSSSAVGILIGAGNVGETLESSEKASTFLSTDGGLTWKEIAKSVHKWEYGDQGTILVLVPSQKETNEILYSTDGGQVWEKFQFAESPVSVLDLTTVPTDTARKFIIFAASSTDKSHFTSYLIDFTNYFERQCQLDLDNPDMDDYEYWTPRHPDSVEGCLFGHEAKFLRRAKNHSCFIGDAPLEEGYKVMKNCSCTRDDYECDYNYFLDDDGTCQLVKGLSPSDHKAATCKAPDTFQYFESTGYRKIPLSTCVGGKLFDALNPRPCPGHEKEFKEFYGRNMSGGRILLVVLIPLFVFIAATWFVYDRGIRRNGGFKRLGQIRLDNDNDFSPIEDNMVDIVVNRVVRGGIIIVTGTIAALKTMRTIDRAMMERLTSALFGGRPGRRNYVHVPDDEDELFGNFDTYNSDQLDSSEVSSEVNFEVQDEPEELDNYDSSLPADADARLFDIDEQSDDGQSESDLGEAQTS